MKSIRDRLIAHLQNDNGTINDSTVDALYREANRLPEDTETDLEAVEQWAVGLASQPEIQNKLYTATYLVFPLAEHQTPRAPKVSNPNCCGNRCVSETGEVRTLRLGKTADQGSLILCHACFLHEIWHRQERNRNLAKDCQFEIPSWDSLPVYS